MNQGMEDCRTVMDYREAHKQFILTKGVCVICFHLLSDQS